jgi:metal-responsive CopG/Arc/MetJ family transcriptional regulator
MNTVRLNVTLPEDVAHKLDTLVGSRKKSRFIAETIEEKLTELEHRALAQRLEEGYKATRKEDLSIAKEFESVDLEAWDEY